MKSNRIVADYIPCFSILMWVSVKAVAQKPMWLDEIRNEDYSYQFKLSPFVK